MSTTVIDGSKRGTGVYTPFKALWHLQEIGVLEDVTTYGSSAWDSAHERLEKGAPATRVALIDTSVTAKHPNLEQAIAQDLAIDFFSSRLGIPDDKAGPRLREILASVGPERPEFLPSEAQELWGALRKNLTDAMGAPTAAPDFASKVKPATRASFSAHGTAMAGLIGARPRSAEDWTIAKLMPDETLETNLGFAYAGVDPFCEIVPISTNFDPEPEQLILTMLYSVLIGADVIVLARDFPTPKSLILAGGGTSKDELSKALGVGLTDEEIDGWALLEKVVLAVSDRVPVICAAGNGGDDNVLYPASLAEPDNGILSIGARTALRLPASYTPVSDRVTLYAPSGDGERLDQGLQRVDTVSVSYRPEDHSAKYRDSFQTHMGVPECGAPAAPVSAFSPLDLVSTDVPGRAGYNSSPFAQVFDDEQEILDYRSCFCRFSGTSGAVAVVAGLVSLAISAGKVTTGAAGKGKEIKATMVKGEPSDYKTATPALDWRRFAALP